MEKMRITCPDFSILNQPEIIPGKKNIKDYAHPIDKKIIQMLSIPVASTVFKSIVDMSADAYFGQVIAGGIPVDEKTYPELNRIVLHCVQTLGIKRPYVIISGSLDMNAYTVGNEEEPYVVLGGMLVKAMTPEQLTFVIGHECGHIAMEHLTYHIAAEMISKFGIKYFGLAAAALDAALSGVNLALKAWSRRSEITADRAGLLCAGNLDIAKKSLVQIQAGFTDISSVDIEDYIQKCNRFRKGGILRKVGEYQASHPLIVKRLEALELFAKSQVYCEIMGEQLSADSLNQKQLAAETEKILAVLSLKGKE